MKTNPEIRLGERKQPNNDYDDDKSGYINIELILLKVFGFIEKKANLPVPLLIHVPFFTIIRLYFACPITLAHHLCAQRLALIAPTRIVQMFLFLFSLISTFPTVLFLIDCQVDE